MSVFSDATSDQLNALRSGGWAGELRFAVCPNEVIFQGTVNQTINNTSFISFAWDNTLQGDYQDVVAGMTMFITATDDPLELRNPLLRGRAARDPSSTIFYCNESAINLTDGMIVTVISNFEVLQKDRSGNLVDGWQTFEDLAPLVKGIQSFYYGEDDTSFEFTFAPVGQAMAEGATIVDYTYTIDGITYNTQNLTVTVGYGHHWAYLDITDSNDVSFRFIFEILVCLRDDPAFMYTAHDDVQIEGSTDNGWNVTTTFFAGVSDLLNRTRAAIVAFDLPKTGDAALFNNVAFVGYIVQESTDIVSDAISSTLSQTAFTFQDFASIAAQVPVPSLPIRNVAIPTQWGEMNLPTTQRVASYLLTRYSTLANLCAIDMLYTDSTWFAGEPDIEESTLVPAINQKGDEIQARLIFFPQGDATFEINANFLSDTDRDALPTLILSGNLEPQDIFDYSLPVPYYKTVGQVEAGCATFYTSGATPVKLDALAPATARQEGSERPSILAQLLEANLSQANAVLAAKQRIGDLLEYLNPPVNVPTTFKDGWRILTPSTRVWLTYDLPGTDSTRGLPIVSTDRYWLQSVSFSWSVENGVWDVSGVSRLETRGGVAQTKATPSPNTITTDVPILPILSDYDAFVPDSSLNYQTTDPAVEDQQPFNPFDLSQYTPMTTEDAANTADNTPTGECAVVTPAVNFSVNTSQVTPRATIPGETYTVTVKGSARIFEPDAGALFSVGTILSHTGDVWRVESVGNAIVWGNMLDANNCYTMSFTTVSGTFTTGTCVDCAGNGISFGSLPASIRYVDWGSGIGTFVLDITFTDGPSPKDGDAFYEENNDGEWELYTGGRGLLINGTPLGSPPLYNENHEYTFTYIGDGNQTPFNYQDSDYTDNANVPLPITVCGPNMGS